MEEAIRSGSIHRVHELIRSGTNVNARSKSGNYTMLILAITYYHQNIALALLAAGADVHAKDDLQGQTALHWACASRLEEVVQALIDRGSQVDEEDRYGETPLSYATNNAAISMRLLRAGASCECLLGVMKNELFHRACRVGDVLAVGILLRNGCSVDTLSSDEQEALLRCACLHCDSYVAGTLLKNGCSASKLTDTEILYLVNHLPEELLYSACREGNVCVVEKLIAAGCNVNCVSSAGDTPLTNAAREGHEEVVKKLILADANLALKDKNGDTALHCAASHNHIQCGILLVEGGASARAKNQFFETPLDIGEADFQEAIKQTLLFTTRKALCIIGNAESGKSTLIASLQAESNWFLGRIFNHFRRVNDPRKRTAGIETVPYSSQKYGEVLFFDFAGQDDYHGPHQMFLESLLTKPGVSMTLLLVIKLTEAEETILHLLHRWLSPVALMSTTASPPRVIVIGSFMDKVKSKQEATGKLIRCIVETKIDLVELPLQFVGTCFLNCRQPQSEGIDQLCGFLQEVRAPELKATHTGYSLAWILSQIKLSTKDQALQLQEFSTWIEGNKTNLPRTMPAPEEVCQDLSATGHALYLPNKEDPPKSWLVLELPGILHGVYGTLFSRSKDIVNEFGLLHCRHLAEVFPDLDLAMIQQLLISLEFCIPVDPSVLKVDLGKLTQSNETSGWLFFPSLISAKPPQASLDILPEQSVHCLCWHLRTSKKHSISARILQTILLRLAAHFVVKQDDEEGVQQHYCSIWRNGIAWQSTVGVSITVHIQNNRVIKVFAAGEMADELREYLSAVISDIISTVRQLSPNLAAEACIVHPPNVATPAEDITDLPPKKLFPVEGIRNSIREHKRFVFSRKDNEDRWNILSIADLFGGCTPALEYIEKITWTQPELSQSQTVAELSLPTERSGALAEFKVVPSGAQALLRILSAPDMRDVNELVVTPVAADWQRLALELGVKDYVIRIVFKDHPGDCVGACLDMLGRWLRGERHTGEEERTWSTLLTALGRAGFTDLERSLRREHFTKQ